MMIVCELLPPQVNQGVEEYTVFLRDPQLTAQPRKHTERLKEVYR